MSCHDIVDKKVQNMYRMSLKGCGYLDHALKHVGEG